VSKDRKTKRDGKKSTKSKDASDKNLRDKKKRKSKKRKVITLSGALLFGGGLITASLTGATESLWPVDSVVDKLNFTDAIKVDSVEGDPPNLDTAWPVAFDDPKVAEDYAQIENAGSNRGWNIPTGGVLVTHDNTARIRLRSNREQTILIKDIRVSPLEKLPPVANALVCPNIDKGGGEENERIYFDLDSGNPIGMSVGEDYKPTDVPYKSKRTVTLAKDEIVGFQFYFHTSEYHVRFSLTIDYQIGSSEHGSVKIDEIGGKQFEFTAPHQKPSVGSAFLYQKDQAPDYLRMWLPAKYPQSVTEVDPGRSSTSLQCWPGS
jgi:hypothetical protein